MTREAKDMTSIKTQVAQGRYQVDCNLVADALIARWCGGWLLPHSACSKPSSSPSESKNRTSG